MPWLNFLSRFNDLREGYTKPENCRYECDFHSCFHPDNSQLSDAMHRILYKAQYIFQGRSQKGPDQGRPGPLNIFLTYVKERRSRNRKYITSGSPKFLELPTALPLFEKVVNRCGWIPLYFICIFAKKKVIIRYNCPKKYSIL